MSTASKKYHYKALRDCIKYSIALLFTLAITIISAIVNREITTHVNTDFSTLFFIILICLAICIFIFFLDSKHRYLEIYSDKVEYHYGICFKKIKTIYAGDLLYYSIIATPLQKICTSSDIILYTPDKSYYFCNIENGGEIEQIIFQMAKKDVCDLNNLKEDFNVTNSVFKKFNYKCSNYIHIMFKVYLICIIFNFLNFLLTDKENVVFQLVIEKDIQYNFSWLFLFLFILWKQKIFQFILFCYIGTQYLNIFIYKHSCLVISSDKIEYIYGWPLKHHIFVPLKHIYDCSYYDTFLQHFIYHTSDVHIYINGNRQLTINDMHNGIDAYDIISHLVKDN